MGGYDGVTRMSSCEYFDPETHTWHPGPDMVRRRSGADATTGPDGTIYVAGGTGKSRELCIFAHRSAIE